MENKIIGYTLEFEFRPIVKDLELEQAANIVDGYIKSYSIYKALESSKGRRSNVFVIKGAFKVEDLESLKMMFSVHSGMLVYPVEIERVLFSDGPGEIMSTRAELNSLIAKHENNS